MKESDFIIRVYGIYIDPLRGVLVSDEKIKGKNITKFPGGGLEYGEGTIECLKRELLEETGNNFDVVDHFYTTDFFVESAFHTSRQVISIYYLVRPLGDLQLKLEKKPFDFEKDEEGAQSFRFILLDNLNPDDFVLSIDNHVANILTDEYK